MNPLKIECIKLAIQAGAKEELIAMAKKIENYISPPTAAGKPNRK